MTGPRTGAPVTMGHIRTRLAAVVDRLAQVEDHHDRTAAAAAADLDGRPNTDSDRSAG